MSNHPSRVGDHRQTIVGLGIIAVGLFVLISNLTGVNLCGAVCPLALILLGVALILRVRRTDPGTVFQVNLIGDVHLPPAGDARQEGKPVSNRELWVGIGDVDLDLEDKLIPAGETKFRVFGFVGEVNLRVPEGVGVSLSSLAFVTDAKILGFQQTHILTPIDFSSDGYEEIERKIRLEILAFVSDVRVRQTPSPTATNLS
jgi:predicted membrane protein